MFPYTRAKEPKPPEGMELFITASDNFEADIIESFLKTSGIPVIRRHRESGDFLTVLMGNTAYGIDLFVPEERAKEARELLETVRNINDEEILADPSFSDEGLVAESHELLRKLDNSTKWIIGIIASIVLILVLLVIINP